MSAGVARCSAAHSIITCMCSDVCRYVFLHSANSVGHSTGNWRNERAHVMTPTIAYRQEVLRIRMSSELMSFTSKVSACIAQYLILRMRANLCFAA